MNANLVVEYLQDQKQKLVDYANSPDGGIGSRENLTIYQNAGFDTAENFLKAKVGSFTLISDALAAGGY